MSNFTIRSIFGLVKRLPVVTTLVIAGAALAVALTWPAHADDDPAQQKKTQDENAGDGKDQDQDDKARRNRAQELDDELDKLIEDSKELHDRFES
jgi:TolA-binding protein